jgi:ABC-type dipeptide/oligopeptide/nickel transport system permease subunit
MSAPATGGATWLRGLLLAWVLWALLGLVWTPYDARAQLFRESARAGPSADHWLGIDSVGRDVLSRVWQGSGHTVVFGATAASGSLLVAAVLLVIERRGSRWVRQLLRALIAAGLAMPVFLVGLILLVFLPASPWTVVLGCAVGGVPLAFRQLRVMWIEQTGALHVLASRALGATRRHVAWFSIWPNIRPQAASLARLLFAMGVLEFAGLSFLGLNGDPDLAELGAMLRQNQGDLFQQPLLVVWPGVMLSGLLYIVHVSGARGGRPRRPAT